ncbi:MULTISPECIES: hypothetical protein [Paenibacillus]|nr:MULTISPECIES: hypothetical protein [Paenibacillus]AWP25207.1 hypothetical protein B9D94_00555 [Paenibacillus sp. Cedars]MBX4152577.1 hypothetical protein [Paenibacillus lautus]
MFDEHLIKELEFVLTHPHCNVEKIESFYNNCLMMNESVPVYAFVKTVNMINPQLLEEWSNKNPMVRVAAQELGVKAETSNIRTSNFSIQISIDLSGHLPKGGLYKVVWSSELEEGLFNQMFKRRAIHVIDRKRREVELIGFRFLTDRNCTLYLKVKEESA